MIARASEPVATLIMLPIRLIESIRALAPIGGLLAVLGHALETFGGWLSGQLIRIVAPE